ncbi:lithostathine-like [Pecten maximus]|uniref:lithostathine-like n=1 Tax=Pecten maximus TaxID=6579 RepID=UPI0014585630|nr:lithostathine-like [Pecten maximus]
MGCIYIAYLFISAFLISVSQQQAIFTGAQRQKLEDAEIEKKVSEQLWPLVDEYATNAFNEVLMELRQKFLTEIDLLSDEIDSLADKAVQVEEAINNISLVADVTRPRCPETTDGHYILQGNHCFMFRDEKLSWAQAKLWCNVKGGHLARPTTTKINDFLKRECKIRGKQFWIGGHDTVEEGRWVWDNGDPIPSNIMDWAPGEPNNYGTGQDCLGIGQDSHRKWDDKACSFGLEFVCQTAAVNN